MTHDDDTIDWNTVPPAKMFHIVMQEIVDMRNELKQQFKKHISDLKNELGSRIDSVASELHTLRLEVHQNHSTFIINQQDHGKRITKLEMAV